MSATGRPFIVLLPGTLCDARIFSAFKRRLRPHAQVYRTSYEGMKDVRSWLRALLHKLPEKFYVAGFSLGGLLALELLRMAKDRIQGIALIASNAQAADQKSQRKSAMLHHLWLHQGASVVARHVKPAYFHHEASRRKHERLVFDMALRTPQRSAFEEFAWAAQRPDGLQTLRDYSGKVLAVSGAQDRLCPRAWQQAMQTAQPRMQWREIARCGHFVPLEAPIALCSSVFHWLFDEKPPVAGMFID
jgi:pimeloyl-ACP methyl ester carboxylesterase